jgi:hypothetical protein
LQHVTRRNSKGPIALVGEPLIANLVVDGGCAASVRFAIDLDCQTRL